MFLLLSMFLMISFEMLRVPYVSFVYSLKLYAISFARNLKESLCKILFVSPLSHGGEKIKFVLDGAFVEGTHTTCTYNFYSSIKWQSGFLPLNVKCLSKCEALSREETWTC